VLGEPRIHVAVTESTQSLLDPSLPEGAIATAGHQTGGRGRLGRTWEDVPGASLLLSVLLKPPAGRNPPELTLVGALAVARAIGPDAQIKWPNDVLVDGQKVSGGIADLREGAVILGIGVNVNQTADELPRDTRTPAASLRSLDGGERDVETLLAAVLHELDDAYRTWLDHGLAALHPEIAARDALRGTAGYAGIRPDGRLELANGELMASGEIPGDVDVA
jgi:BirA family transcriptional regulator, biotin operon repressor / biotin---[acetyl-CoA-carboxylase] ligase